jgi:hypothetical protein
MDLLTTMDDRQFVAHTRGLDATTRTRQAHDATWRRFLATARDIDQPQVEKTHLTSDLLEACLGRWWRDAAKKNREIGRPDVPLEPDTLGKYASRIVQQASNRGWIVDPDTVDTRTIHKRYSALNHNLVQANPSIIGRRDQQRAEPLTHEVALRILDEAKSQVEIFTAKIMILASALNLRPGEILAFHPSMRQETNETFPSTNSRGEHILWFNIPRPKTKATNKERPVMMQPFAVPHFWDVKELMIEMGLATVGDLKIGRLKANAVLANTVRALATRANLPRADAIRLYSCRHGGITSNSSLPPAIQTRQAGLQPHSRVIGSNYGFPTPDAVAATTAVRRPSLAREGGPSPAPLSQEGRITSHPLPRGHTGQNRTERHRTGRDWAGQNRSRTDAARPTHATRDGNRMQRNGVHPARATEAPRRWAPPRSTVSTPSIHAQPTTQSSASTYAALRAWLGGGTTTRE